MVKIGVLSGVQCFAETDNVRMLRERELARL